jgi:hypothetical protein
MLQTCPASCHSYHIASRRLLASISANRASCTPLLGDIPGSACLLHAARRHLRYLARITSFAYALLQIGPACSIPPTLPLKPFGDASDAPWALVRTLGPTSCMKGNIDMRGTTDCVDMLSNDICTCATSKTHLPKSATGNKADNLTFRAVSTQSVVTPRSAGL